ncbi:hypothetical protein FPQ18DRAFT_387220 [Pyronema domesticum]|uniref:Uncharacterized protein n=1 Tax=Pyronema omphalodes (strain CBS 100304) TaxID=1076935 RepID=U4KXY5_PYROM|nr:hypothetical protein FPQ18DRAFT_387220 [Pyronema domesticum]CCX06801.1 Protein of unknown function [Pyronema omphalodes CBS 100304]
MAFNPTTAYELDATTNSLSPQYMVYRRYGDLTISPCINLGLFPTLYLANLAASNLCATEFGDIHSTKALSNGGVVYKRLGEGNSGPDDIMMIFTGLGSIPIMATVNSVTPKNTTAGPLDYTSYTSPISSCAISPTSYTFFNTIPALSTRYRVYRLHRNLDVSRCSNLGPFTTLSEANLAAENISADEFGDRYGKEQFSNGLVSFKRLGKGDWNPEDTIGFYTNSDSEYMGLSLEDGYLSEISDDEKIAGQQTNSAPDSPGPFTFTSSHTQLLMLSLSAYLGALVLSSIV